MEVENNLNDSLLNAGIFILFTLFICFILWQIATRSSASVVKTEFNPMNLPTEFNLMGLPTVVLTQVAGFVSSNELKSFGLVNKKCNEIRQHLLNVRLIECVDLRKFFYLNEEKFLERVKDLEYKCVALYQCYYLSPRFITELVSKESFRVLDLTECNCTPEVIEAVDKLNLTSLGISLSKTWREFFVLSENKSVAVLNGLKQLKIFQRFRSIFLMSHVSRYVLPHCHRLQFLKLSTQSSVLTVEEEGEEDFLNPKFIPTPVPYLETLVLDFFNYNDLTQQIKLFLDVILYEKKIPLKKVDLGYQTITAILNGILRHHNISFENAHSLYLDNYSVSSAFHPNLNARDVTSVIQSMPKTTKYELINVLGFYISDCSRFTDVLVKSGITSVKKVNLNGCVFNDNICHFIDNISNLSSGLTYLDISLTYWPRTLAQNTQIDNSDLMKSIANLTNLRTLCIVPAMLSYKTSKDEKSLKSSLYEVAKKCKSLRIIRIADNANTEFINQDVLLCIKFFKNLRELYLINFSIKGRKRSVFPEIVEHCSKLNILLIKNVLNETKMEEFLVHAKKMKHLYLDQNFKMTKTFVDNLSKLTHLEKLHLSFSSNHNVKVLKYFAKNLIKLDKLQFLNIKDLNILSDDYFLSAYNEIKELRPRFYFKNLEDQPLPMVHQDFLKKYL